MGYTARNFRGYLSGLGAAKVVFEKARGKGIQVDIEAPTFPWQDLLGEIRPKASGAGSPTLAALAGANYQAFSFAANDVCDLEFHIPHDHVPGSDLFIHIHWAHNGTAISGSLVVNYYHHYAKGHQQAIFAAEKTLTQTILTPDIATVPQLSHRIDEIQISAASPAASQIDTDDLEPDGLILVRLQPTTIPTITGGTPRPFILFADLHYQSTSIGTKQKAPDFWT